MAWRATRRARARGPASPLGAQPPTRYARRVSSARPSTRRSPRACACGLSAAGLLALAGASAPATLAASPQLGHSFSELTEHQPEETTTTTATSAVSTNSKPTNSSSVFILAIAAVVVVLSGIAFVIVRDARRVAPANDADVMEARSAHDSAVKLRKRRAKAKAARQQRKRNR
jgi:hypothetical protein